MEYPTKIAIFFGLRVSEPSFLDSGVFHGRGIDKFGDMPENKRGAVSDRFVATQRPVVGVYKMSVAAGSGYHGRNFGVERFRTA